MFTKVNTTQSLDFRDITLHEVLFKYRLAQESLELEERRKYQREYAKHSASRKAITVLQLANAESVAFSQPSVCPRLFGLYLCARLHKHYLAYNAERSLHLSKCPSPDILSAPKITSVFTAIAMG
ncbi:hypothetical protein CB1_001322007 [Camelus ferus]|nr:hypothetical protein CB1_001322007 [Camelus ferus]